MKGLGTCQKIKLEVVKKSKNLNKLRRSKMALTANEFKRNFLASGEAITIKEELEKMVLDPRYNTRSFYTPQQEENMSFVDKHITYLSEHPKLKTSEYLANLRLMTKAR